MNGLPKTFKNDGNQTYLLAGIIQYYGNELPKNKDDFGHFTTICYRDDKWFEYDDLQVKVKYLNKKFQCTPKVLFYFKK